MAASKAAGKDDFAEWAAQPARSSNGCGICKNHPKTVETVRKYLQMRIEGKTQRGLLPLHSFCAENRGLTMSRSALESHVKNCERELYGQVRG